MFNMKEVNNYETNNEQFTQLNTLSDVYVMPDKFRFKGFSGSNRGIIVSSLILLTVILLTGGYFVYDNWQKLQNSQKLVEKQQHPPIIEIQEDDVNILIPVTTSTEDVVTSTIIFTEDVTTSTEDFGKIKFSLDSDNDGLTDVEEVIFGTAPTNADTDGDGYKDGVEVANGYSPNKAGDVKIYDSPFITSIITNFDFDNFKLFYPKDWRPSLAKASKQLTLTINTGEIITITVKENIDKIPAMSWYLQQNPHVSVSELRIVDSKDLTGIYSSDGFSAYLTDKDKSKFYIFEYIIGKQLEFRYPTIFTMLIKQLEIIPNPVIASNSVVSSTQSEFFYTASTCANFFCATSPCGIQPDGSNSCESAPPRGICYLNACKSDLDCLNGLSCNEVNCYSGNVLTSNMVCK